MSWTIYVALGFLCCSGFLALNWCWSLSRRHIYVFQEVIDMQKQMIEILQIIKGMQKNGQVDPKRQKKD